MLFRSSTTSNLNFTIGNIVKKVINILLAPVLFILKAITSSIKDIGGVLNTMRKFISNMRSNILGYFRSNFPVKNPRQISISPQSIFSFKNEILYVKNNRQKLVYFFTLLVQPK